MNSMLFIILAILIYGLIGFLLIYNKRFQIKKILKNLYIIGAILLFIGLGGLYYVFNKAPRNIEKEKPSFTMSAEQLYKEFSTSEDSSYAIYGDKIIEVTGSVSDIIVNNNGASLTLLDEISGINCSFDSISVAENRSELIKIKHGDNVSLKGKCDGYDMIMGVVLSRCVLIKIN
jgi:hypothetical protein